MSRAAALRDSTPTRRWTLLLSLLALAAPACNSVSRVGKLGKAKETDQLEQSLAEARLLADAGELRGAIVLLEAWADEGSLDPALLFTLGWLYERRGGTLFGEARSESLRVSRGYYEHVLELVPENAQARTNLALVLRKLGDLEGARAEIERIDPPTYAALVALGDIESSSGDRDAALEHFTAAYRLDQRTEEGTRDDLAATRIVLLLQEDLPARAERLKEYLEEFEAEGLLQVASWGYEALVRVCGPDAAGAFEHWLSIEARRGTLSPPALDRLPRPGSCEQLDAALGELAGLVALAEVTEVPGVGDAPDEDQGASVTDENPIERAARALEYWTADVSRRYAISRAVQSIARGRMIDGNYAVAAAIFEEGIARVAPDASDYDEGGALRGRPDVGLDMALDLVLLYHNFRTELDPDRTRLRALLREHSLDSFSEQSLVTLDRTPEEMQKVHTVLGLVYAELDSGWTGPAEYHLERASAIAREIAAEEGDSASEFPLPHLTRTIGDGLAASDGALDAYIDAAHGYIDQGRRDRARRLYPDARAVATSSRKKLFELEELLYPPEGVYFGVSGGWTHIDSSGGDLDDDLTDRGNDVSVSFDSDNSGWKMLVGYRFEVPLAIELGFASLGGPDSHIVEHGPGAPGLTDDVEDVHPRSGEGPTLAVVWTPLQYERWSAGAKVGGWYWSSDIDVDVDTAMGVVKVEDHEDGFDLFYGVGLQYKIGRQFTVKAEYERYEVDSDNVDFLSIGLLYQL